MIDKFVSTSTLHAEHVKKVTEILIAHKAILQVLLPNKANDPGLLTMADDALQAAKDAATIVKFANSKNLNK